MDLWGVGGLEPGSRPPQGRWPAVLVSLRPAHPCGLGGCSHGRAGSPGEGITVLRTGTRFGLRPGPARPCHPVMPSLQTAQNRTRRANLWLDSVWRAPWEKAGGLLWALLCGCCLNTLHPEALSTSGQQGALAGRQEPGLHACGSCVGHGVLHVSSSVLFLASGRQPYLLLCGLSRLQAQTWSLC